MDKLGYRGLDTCELIFDNHPVPAENLVGDEEGRGFGQVMSGLETGRINVGARAVGVAQAAFNAAIRYAQQRETFGKPISEHQVIQTKLADMATKIQAARLLVYDAAAKKDSGERVDLESGMAKLFASEVCGEVTMEAMRIHGGYGFIKESPVERYYRDAPLMIIGEGTNEVLRLVIARPVTATSRIPSLEPRVRFRIRSPIYPHPMGEGQDEGPENETSEIRLLCSVNLGGSPATFGAIR